MLESEQGLPYRKIKLLIEQGDEAVLLCRGCYSHPDDPLLLKCGHVYCFECFEYRTVCQVPGCCEEHLSLMDFSEHMEAIRQIFGISVPANAVQFDSDQDSKVVDMEFPPPKASCKMWYRTQPQVMQNITTSQAASDSEDDGWEHKSQRSVSYRDDGCSFVADDNSSVGGLGNVDLDEIIPAGMTLSEFDDLVDFEEIGEEQQERQELIEEIEDLD